MITSSRSFTPNFCFLFLTVFFCFRRGRILSKPEISVFSVEPHLIIPIYNKNDSADLGRPILEVFTDMMEASGREKSDELFSYFIQVTSKMIFSCDQFSYHVIDFIFANMYYFAYYKKLFNNFPDIEKYHYQQYMKELNSTKEKYNCTYHLQEAFYFKHGLRLAPPPVRKFISTRDILDVGAFIGDSAIALDDQTNGKIASYEFAPSTFEHLQETLKYNRMNNDRHIAIRKGVSSKREIIKVNSFGAIDAKISNRDDNGIETEITTVDNEVKILNLIPGFIKADIEGSGLDLIHGSKQTIQKFRPVFYIAAYHRASELFGVPKFLINHNYIIRYYLENINMLSMGEVCVFAYPKELILNELDFDD